MFTCVNLRPKKSLWLNVISQNQPSQNGIYSVTIYNDNKLSFTWSEMEQAIAPKALLLIPACDSAMNSNNLKILNMKSNVV